MKLSEAIQKGLLKKGVTFKLLDDFIVGYKIDSFGHRLYDLDDARFEIKILSDQVSDGPQSNSDVGKTFLLSKAKGHLKVGMKIMICNGEYAYLKATTI